MTWLQDSLLSDPNFADDITALADNAHDLQDLIDMNSEHTGTLGLSINAKKTKYVLTGDH